MAKIELSNFFTTTNEREGVWYEPTVNDEGIGIEFKILGYSSDENVISADAYSKEHEQIEKETDPKKKAVRERDAIVKRIASVITDIRGKDGNSVVLDGKEIEYSNQLIEKILYENIDIRTDLFRATIDTSNFMMKKD